MFFIEDFFTKYRREENTNMSLVKISTFLSFVLRHRPDSIGIELDEHGWANVEELIEGVKGVHPIMDMELLERIVREDEKMR